MESKLINIKDRKQLFFDDYCIEKSQDLIRQYNKPKKHPANPLLRPEEYWEKYTMELYGNIIYDPMQKSFQMWYNTRSVPLNDDCIVAICHATSDDGINWKRTRVNHFDAMGHNVYNAVLVGRYCGPTVFYTPDAEEDKRYRMFVYEMPTMLSMHKNKTLFRYGAYSIYFSPDGINWTDFEYNPVIQGGDISTCSYDPVVEEYIAYPRTHTYLNGVVRRCVGICTSKDFMSWSTSSDIILSADEIDDARVDSRLKRFRDSLCFDDPSYYCADIQGMTGFRYEDFHVGLMWFFDKSARIPVEFGGNEDGILNIQLAYKRCNIKDFWHRADDRSDFITCGEPGAFDGAMIFTAHTVVEVGDELWFYYSGFSRSHGHGNYHIDYLNSKCCLDSGNDRTGIGLAILRRDGFVSMDSSYPGGVLITKPFKVESSSLEINAFAQNGYVKVEILNEQDNPIEGYGEDDCIPFSADEIHHKIRWKNSNGLRSLQGKIVKLAFHMRAAKLYSFSLI